MVEVRRIEPLTMLSKRPTTNPFRHFKKPSAQNPHKPTHKLHEKYIFLCNNVLMIEHKKMPKTIPAIGTRRFDDNGNEDLLVRVEIKRKLSDDGIIKVNYLEEWLKTKELEKYNTPPYIKNLTPHP